MEQVVDRLIAEMEELRVSDEFKAVLEIDTDVKWDDPGFVIVDEYPYMFVAPLSDEPLSETAGRAGYDVRRLTAQVGIVINSADFFDPLVSEAPGSRVLVAAMGLVRARLRRLSKRQLDLVRVRNVVVQGTGYGADLRNTVFVRVAATNIIVDRQYPHEE